MRLANVVHGEAGDEGDKDGQRKASTSANMLISVVTNAGVQVILI